MNTVSSLVRSLAWVAILLLVLAACSTPVPTVLADR